MKRWMKLSRNPSSVGSSALLSSALLSSALLSSALLSSALLLGVLSPSVSHAGELPVEVDADRLDLPATGGNCLIRRATVVTVSHGTIPDASVVVRGGRIAAIVSGDVEADEGAYVIDAAGAYLSPGIIDCHSHIAMRGGTNESTASVTAEVRVADQVNGDDASIYRALAGGCTTANLLHGSANAIGGQSAVIKLKYRRPGAELLFPGAPRGIKFALGENPTRASSSSRGSGRFPATRMGVEAVIRRSFVEAMDYSERWRRFDDAIAAGEDPEEPRRDLRLETLVGVLSGEVRVHCHSYRADEMLMLMRLAEEFGFRIATFQHVLEGYKVAVEMAEHGAAGSTFSDWWAYKQEAYEAIPYNAALLHRAGVNVSLNSDSSELMRRLNMEAAKAIRYGGVEENAALAMVTLNPAQQLGIDGRVGSIEVGKDADLVVWSAHPLSVYAKVLWTLVDGEVGFRREGSPSALDLDLEDTRTAGDVSVNASPIVRKVRGPRSGGRVAIHGATVHSVSGPSIEGGTILMRDGRIEAIGADVAVPQGYEKIDASGLHAWPGMIDPSTYLGLTEVGSVPSTVDTREQGSFQPDLRAAVAMNPDSEHLGVAFADGVTTAVVRPRGSLVLGQSVLAHLRGWTWEEMSLVDPLALHVATPGWGARKDDAQLAEVGEDRQVKELMEWFDKAREYGERRESARASKRAMPPTDTRLEALLPYIRGERPVIFDADDEKAVRQVIALGAKLGVRPIVCGGREAWKAAADLARADVPVLLGPVLTNPSAGNDPYDSPFSAAAILHRAGVRFAFTTKNSSSVRSLPQHAGVSVAFGLDRDEALRAVTLRAAEILGVDHELGSLEVGKIADVVLTDGDLLEVRSSVRRVFLSGREVSRDNQQSRLYERYAARIEEAKRSESSKPASPSKDPSSDKRPAGERP